MKTKSQLFFDYNKKFLGYLIRRGLKFKALNKYNEILISLKLKENMDPRLILFTALLNLSPVIIIKNRIKGRRKIPYIQLAHERVKITKAVSWIIKDLADKQKNRNPQTNKIVESISDILRNKGDNIKKKYNIYATARNIIS